MVTAGFFTICGRGTVRKMETGMDYWEIVRRRRSVRAYQRREVTDDNLTRILESANLAPSAGNLQAYEIVVVRDSGRRKKLASAALDQGFVAEAPVALVFFANPGRNRARYGQRGLTLYCIQDATIACAYTQLAATALGLATCWVGAFEDGKVSEITGAPAEWKPVAILPVGYPAESPEMPPRRPLTDIVHRERART
jgi:nitroreductase